MAWRGARRNGVGGNTGSLFTLCRTQPCRPCWRCLASLAVGRCLSWRQIEVIARKVVVLPIMNESCIQYHWAEVWPGQMGQKE